MLLPELYLLSTTISLLIYGVVVHNARNITSLGVVSVLITMVLVANQNGLSGSPCYNTLVVDLFTYYCKLALLVSAAGTLLISMRSSLELKKQLGQSGGHSSSKTTPESIVLMLLSTSSMLFMISAYDLITIYLTIELQSLCFYVLAASKRTSEFSTEAGLKYFLLGAFSSGILLFGCSMIYGFTGVTNLEQLAKLLTVVDLPNGVYLGMVFVAVAFLFKLTAVPFHMWAPDVYEGSPTYVTAFFSIAPKIALFACMLRIFLGIESVSSLNDLELGALSRLTLHSSVPQELFAICSLASMILGSLAGLAQTKVKRLLAYSSIANVGYLLIGLACGTIEGVQALLIGLFIYVVMTLNAFTVVLSLPQNRQQYISDLSALARSNPLLAITLSLTMFSYAGIPPLAGFCSKYALFLAALGSGAYLLALVGIITSVISCFYYIRFVKVMYFDAPLNWIYYKPMDQAKSLVLAITMLLTTLFFLYPSPLFLVTHQMALTLCM